MTVIDVGANIGVYTLYFSKLVGSEGHVYSFEPAEGNFKLLQNNLKLNNSNNVIAYNKAVFNRNTQKLFSINKIHMGDHSLDVNKSHRSNTFTTTKCIALDSVIKDDTVNIIKIDIQGGELNALEGMINIIKRSPNLMIVMEYDTSLMLDNHSRFIGFCNANNLIIQRIHKTGLSRVKYYDKLLSVNERYFNIVLSKKSVSV